MLQARNRSNLLFIRRPNSDLRSLSNNSASMWVKIVSSWLCLALYAWSLAAPLVLTNRDFN